MNPEFVQEHPGRVTLALKVQPRSPHDAIGETVGHELKVKVAAPPTDDAANEALVRFLARQLQCPLHAIRLVRGRSSRHKVVEVHGLSATTALARLGFSGPQRPPKAR